jgi:hypothetical protein
MSNSEKNKTLRDILNGHVWHAANKEDYEQIKRIMLNDLFVAVTTNRALLTISKANVKMDKL